MRKTLPLLLILFLACIVRLYKIDIPIADWHSWRQVDTSAVSREFVNNGFDLLHPKYHDLSNVPSGKDNPEGYRFVEFPLFNVAQAGLYRLFGGLSLETWGRMVSVIASVCSTMFLFLLVKRHADTMTAFFAGLFFALLPFNIFYGRTILPDSSMVMAILGGIYFFDRFLRDYPSSERNESRSKSSRQARTIVFYFLSALFTSAALLLKPYAIFFTLPMIVLAWQAYGVKFTIKWQLWLFVLLAVIPLVWWRSWMLQYPEGIPVNEWLFNGGGIRFKGAFFYWLFADRLGRLILGYWGMGLFFMGLLANSYPHHIKKHGVFFYSFLVSSLLYLVVIARGNVQHDYYQILIIPSIALFIGLGARALFYPPKEYIHMLVSRLLLSVGVIFMLGFGWYFVRDYYNINNQSLIVAGAAVDRLTPKDAKVIAAYDGDTTFLYYTNRKGWASFQRPLEEMVAMGATHLVLLNPQEKDLGIGSEYKIVEYKKEYLLFELQSTND